MCARDSVSGNIRFMRIFADDFSRNRVTESLCCGFDTAGKQRKDENTAIIHIVCVYPAPISAFSPKHRDKNDRQTTWNVCLQSRNLVRHLSAEPSCTRPSPAAGNLGRRRWRGMRPSASAAPRFRSGVFPASETSAACSCQSAARARPSAEKRRIESGVN